MRLTCMRLSMVIVAFGLLLSCAQQTQSTQRDNVSPARSVLESSAPAAGSSVKGPLNSLALRFNPPARLTEITVTGPDGTMPMMVTAVGEVKDYSLPLPGLGAGNHTVNWKATAAGQSYQGSFEFTVRD